MAGVPTRVEIEGALRPLLGRPLREAVRIVDMETFGFGDRVSASRPGGPTHAAEFALHVQCRWRIVRDRSILVGSADVFWPPDGSDTTYRDFDYDGARSRRDDLIDAFMTHGAQSHIVATVSGASTGDARLVFRDGCALELWPDHRSGGDGDGPAEHWRVFQTEGVHHFVVGTEGFDPG